jgi:prevent-host-death family protein
MSIPAAVFKAECLRLMDEVARTGQSIVITKHGKPVAQLVPAPAAPESLFGYMRDTVTIEGDVVAPTGEAWDADSSVHELSGSTSRKPSRPRGARPKK